MDSHTLAIFAAVAVAIVAAYFIVMRVFFRESRELDRHIDYTKMKQWKDEEE